MHVKAGLAYTKLLQTFDHEKQTRVRASDHVLLLFSLRHGSRTPNSNTYLYRVHSE